MFLKSSLHSAHFQQREHRPEWLRHPAPPAHAETLRCAGSVLWKLPFAWWMQSVSLGLRENLKSLKHIPDAGVNNMVNNERAGFFFAASNTAYFQLTMQALPPLLTCLSAAAPELSSHRFLFLQTAGLYNVPTYLWLEVFRVTKQSKTKLRTHKTSYFLLYTHLLSKTSAREMRNPSHVSQRQHV